MEMKASRDGWGGSVEVEMRCRREDGDGDVRLM